MLLPLNIITPHGLLWVVSSTSGSNLSLSTWKATTIHDHDHLPLDLMYVMVEAPLVPFSPFSLADCTMLSHFSFNDFIAIAFPDLARDLDIQL